MFRILSIDGGGVRGIYPAHLLTLFSNHFGSDLSATFDLIVGTSTGAIIAAAAATQLPIDNVVRLYETRAKQIFARRRFAFGGVLRSAYDSSPLRKLLEDLFDDRTMAAACTRLVLPATDLSNGNVYVIKSPYLPSFVRDKDTPIVTAIMASCAAPSYFDPVRLNEYLLADGGLWGNNPSLIAYTEAIGKLGISPDEVRILSIGTGTGHHFYDPGRPTMNWGFATGWEKRRLVDVFMNLQSRVATNSATLLLRDRYCRISFEETGALALDDISVIPRLKAKAGEAFTYQSEKIKSFLAL